jgi:uncharacterized membrane protein
MTGLALILALIALVLVLGVRSGLTALQARLATALDEINNLRAQVAALRHLFPAPPQPEAAAAPVEAPPVATPEAAPSPPPVEVEGAPAASEPPEVVPQPEAAAPSPTPSEAPLPVPGPTPTPAPSPTTQPAPSLEEQIGTRWAVWLGGLALAIGGVLLVRYSIEQGVFGPEVRVALGAAFALLLIAAGEWFRRSERASPVEGVPSAHIPGILTAAGTISAFGTVYSAHALYGFIGPAAAFSLLGAIGIATMLAAALHGPALAGLGLAGSFAVPLLVASQQPDPWPVVLYLAVVATAAYALSRLRRWLWLASATVAGAIAWGFALLGPVSSGAGGPAFSSWALALIVHVGVQLALAAVFMAIGPHRQTADADAEPDWIATLALAALSALVVRTLQATAGHEQWLAFAGVAIAILGLTAVRSAPAAGAAVLAGSVALAGILLWPGLTSVAELPLQAPAPLLPAQHFLPALPLESLLRLPDNVTDFLVFAAVSTLALCVLATLRLWRSRTLPMGTVGLYALAAVVPPLLALALAYLRVTQFDRSIPFALFAVGLAAILYVVADLFDRSAPAATRSPAMSLVIGAFASGVAAAMALAFSMALDRGYLTVAFAITAFTTAIFAVVDRIPMLRYVVVAIGLIVLGRLAWDPRIMGAEVGTWPILNWLLIGYGVPAAAFLGAGYILKRRAEDMAARLSDGLGVLLAALLVYFQIRHGLNNGDPFAPTSGHVEQGLFALMSIAFAAVLTRLDRGRANPVFRVASLLFGVISAGVIAMGLGLIENPFLSGEPVRGPVVASTLLLAYLVPGVAGIVLSRLARGARPDWYVNGAAALGLILIYGYAALELRHAFHGEVIAIDRGASAPELGLLAFIGIALAVVLIRLDRVRPDPTFQAGSLLFGVASAVVIAVGLGLKENPLLTTDPVHGLVGLSTLLPAYLLPGLAAAVLVRTARGVRPHWYVTLAAALALALVFAYVTLEVRHAFQGERLTLDLGASAPEVWSYSAAWLMLGLVFLLYGLWRGSTEARLASAALVVLSVLKVFLYDLTGIGGFWRALSMICLGLVLIGIGLIYQRLIFARPATRQEAPSVGSAPAS